MFTKGSRYRNLTQSSALTASGERLQGVDLRIIAERPATFRHTVQDGERLDLLAYKYYGDPTKWWQICDANGVGFPIELVNIDPLVQLQLQLTRAGSDTRYEALLTALGGLGTVDTEEHDFVKAVVAMTYDGAPGTRQQILTAVKNGGFNFLSSFHWSAGPAFAEAFSFDDHSVKTEWRAIIEGLGELAGVLAVQSILSEATLTLLFNRSMVNDQAINNLIASKGFIAGPPISFSRAGTAIVVPPNQIG